MRQTHLKWLNQLAFTDVGRFHQTEFFENKMNSWGQLNFSHIECYFFRVIFLFSGELFIAAHERQLSISFINTKKIFWTLKMSIFLVLVSCKLSNQVLLAMNLEILEQGEDQNLPSLSNPLKTYSSSMFASWF